MENTRKIKRDKLTVKGITEQCKRSSITSGQTVKRELEHLVEVRPNRPVQRHLK